MIVRTLKTAAVSILAIQAARQAATQRKLLQVRSEARAEMDRLENILRDMHTQRNGFDLNNRAEKEKFDETLKQLSKWTRIHTRTF